MSIIEDSRSLADRAAAEVNLAQRHSKVVGRQLTQRQKKYPDPEEESRETALHKKDPTLPVRVPVLSQCESATYKGQAKAHGNEPSRGAQIDAELQAEDDKMMKAKSQNLPGKKM